MIGALIGLLLLAGLYTVQFLLDDTLMTAEDVEKEFGVMPLTVIPEGKIEGLSGSESEQSRSRRGRKGKHNG